MKVLPPSQRTYPRLHQDFCVAIHVLVPLPNISKTALLGWRYPSLTEAFLTNNFTERSGSATGEVSLMKSWGTVTRDIWATNTHRNWVGVRPGGGPNRNLLVVDLVAEIVPSFEV